MYTFSTEAIFPNIFKVQLFEPIIQKPLLTWITVLWHVTLLMILKKKDIIHLILQYNVLLY